MEVDQALIAFATASSHPRDGDAVVNEHICPVLPVRWQARRCHRRRLWAATNPACANQALNITNGDLFRWSEMWPKIAAYFELDVAPPLPMNLATIMADKEPLWSAMVARHSLADNSYADVSSWSFGDAVFSWNYDFFADGSKARRLGFHEHVDTAAMFFSVFDDLRRRRIIG